MMNVKRVARICCLNWMTSANCILGVAMVVMVALSACQLRPATRDSSQSPATLGPATTPTATPGRIQLSTKNLAEAYLMALVAGDREAISSLVTGGVVCSPGNFRENIERHLARFSASQVRNIEIEVEAGSPTMHGQQSEVAHISFEYNGGDSAGWRLVRIWVATIPKSTPNQRGICDVSRVNELNVSLEEAPFNGQATNLGLLYLLFQHLDGNDRTESYRLKLFDPQTLTSQYIADLNLPLGFNNLTYADGRLIYKVWENRSFPSREILALDLKTGQEYRLLTLSDQDRRIEDFIGVNDDLILLDCRFHYTEGDIIHESTQCRLQRLSLSGSRNSEPEPIVALASIFDEALSVKSIELYDPEKQALIIREAHLTDVETGSDSNDYYQVSLDELTILPITTEEVVAGRHKLEATDRERCRLSTLKNPKFQQIVEQERIERPFQASVTYIGCFRVEALR